MLEEVEIQALISVDNESSEMLEGLKKLWETTKRPDSRARVDPAWDRMRLALERDSKVRPLVTSASVRAPRARRRSHHAGRQFFRLAAVLAGVALLSTLALRSTFQQQAASSNSESQVFATKNGERAVIQLSDGTRVQLQAGSHLEVPATFADGDRNVHLRGEAYINVSRDEGRPFRVQTSLTTVEVLGTAFNVRAFPEDLDVSVAVTEGKVSLRLLNGVDTLMLRPQELAIVRQNSSYSIHKNADISQYLAWTEGLLVFRNASFKEVATELERWYDLQVELVGSSGEGDGLTAVFGNESLSQILSAISLALDLEYKRDHRRVTFFRAEADAN